MCRHAMLNKKGVELLDKEYGGIEEFLNFLILERGGNGNGLALVKNEKLVYFYKSTDFSIEEICKALRTKDYDYALFHTRLATVGSITDSNCHPFVLSDKFLMSMNGTEDEYLKARDDDPRYDMSDAERVAMDFYKSGESPKDYLLSGKLGSCFCGFYDGKPFVVSNSKNLLRVLSKDDSLVLASDFPWRYDGKNIMDLKEGKFYWDEEEGLPMDKLKEAKHGVDNIVDALTRQLLDKTSDTLVTLLSQKCQISEDELYTYPVGEILSMCELYGIISRDSDVNIKHTR